MSYFIISRVRINDAAQMERYVALAPATVKAFGGRYHARTSSVEAIEGVWEDDRMVVLEFPTRDAAMEWYNSAIYRPLGALRRDASEAVILLVKGLEET